MDKRTILSYIDALAADRLARFIIEGRITISELSENGLDDSKKRRIEEELERIKEVETDFWNKINKESLSDLLTYVEKYPLGKFSEEAKLLIEKIKFVEEKKIIEKNETLHIIRSNPNHLNPYEIKDLLSKGIIASHELVNLNIPERIVSNITNLQPLSLPDRASNEYISDQRENTEIFFWGFMGSGKTTAIGAVLKKADKNGYLRREPNGSGFDYMTRLINIFNGDIGYLPNPSTANLNWYLSFSLKNNNEKYARKISLIDISGEIFQLFYNVNAGLGLESEEKRKTFDDLNKILNNNNRKIHFFFIEYNKHELLDKDLLQVNYLDAASIFFERNKIFGKKTDGIYVVVTKSDLIQNTSYDHLVDNSKRYLNENYTSFVNALRDRCREYGINGGLLTVEPFSIGKVYFQRYCQFDLEPASRILKIFMENIKQDKKCFFDIFKK